MYGIGLIGEIQSGEEEWGGRVKRGMMRKGDELAYCSLTDSSCLFVSGEFSHTSRDCCMLMAAVTKDKEEGRGKERHRWMNEWKIIA